MSLIIEDDVLLKFNNNIQQWEKIYESSSLYKDSCPIQINEMILLLGGYLKYCSNRVIRIQNNITEDWTPMLTSRSKFSALHTEGKIYVIGGFNNDSNEILVNCEVFNMSTEKWSSLPQMKFGKLSPSICLNNNWLYVIGGIGIETIERFHIINNYWETTELRLFHAVSEMALINLDNDQILVLGGKDERNHEINNVWLYNFNHHSMLQKQSLATPCVSLGSFRINDCIYIYDRQKVVEYAIPAVNNNANEINITKSDDNSINYNKHKPKTVKYIMPEQLHILVIKKLSIEEPLDTYFSNSIDYLLSKKCIIYTEIKHPDNQNIILFSVEHASKINLIFTLGGDGTVIWATKLFHNMPIPPIVAFNFGSLGFMTIFPSRNVITILDQILDSPSLSLEIYSRLKYTIIDGNNCLQGECTNEICIDRGAYGSLIELEVYLNGVYCTTAVGDGLLIATPCGSTAYSLSAGGSIVHHAIPSMLITPICPHSLSFRPLIVPDSIIITLRIPNNSRSTGWVNIDGATKHKLGLGAVLEIKISEFCIPCKLYLDVVLENGYSNWISRLRDVLGWNDRKRQKAINSKFSS